MIGGAEAPGQEMGRVSLCLMLVKLFLALVALRLLGGRSTDLFERGSEPY